MRILWSLAKSKQRLSWDSVFSVESSLFFFWILQYFEALANNNPKQIVAKLHTFSKKSKKVVLSFETKFIIDDTLIIVPLNSLA